ncbi:putative Transcriptional Coactivator p15 (PC4) [Paratrimastix pyriformis]|uniref:Transcriptional Coactivator p15 (PC4) n=1 Tax=Paratrimastix pyriformis TaxID=342808 RepID=A0ABQ8UD90_9EUKA|nr:putative Transcriptional Coactivator p15 (PC4) [Paratrimastix pyriformis]
MEEAKLESKKRAPEKEEEEHPEEEKKETKKARPSKKNDEDEFKFELVRLPFESCVSLIMFAPQGSKRFVTVRKFKGRVYVDIREFYEDDGEMKPGKKGISLTPEQWQSLVDKSEEITGATHAL